VNPPRRGPLQRLLSLACEVEPREVTTTLTSFLLVLILMGAYYLLRPVRDAMASNWSDAEVSWLWTITFFFSALAVSLYGAAVTRLRFHYLVPGVYGFFALTFVLFYFASSGDTPIPLADKAFYVWVSVFSLFHISVFWSFMADIFSKPQSKRLFGFIGAGASIGAIAGPAVVTLVAGNAGTGPLLLAAAVMLVLTLPVISLLQRLKETTLNNEAVHATARDLEYVGGNPLSGFTVFLRRNSAYLWGIALFIFLYTAISSFVYFELKNLLADYDEDRRTQIWAAMDLAVNTLTILIAAFATGRMANHLGLPFTLASVPVAICLGMLALAAAPMVALVVAIQIARRAGNYAISRPAREMLFTAVDRETRFKAKPVIDIVIYRGGDMLNAWGFTALTQGLGLGMAAVAGVGALIAAIWALVGIYLGRRFNQSQPVDSSTPQTSGQAARQA
jgi:AAA family ATP:ADP antiporter